MRFPGLAAALMVVGWVAVAGATPEDYLAALGQGLQRAEQGQWEAAGHEFAKATILDPDDGLAYAAQGLCALAGRQLDQAAALFRRAAETRRCDAVAAAGLALCYFEAGNLPTAEVHFQKAITLDAVLPSPWFYGACLDLCHNRLDEAAEKLAKARELGAPELVLDHLQALQLYALGRWQAATDALRQLKPRLTLATPGLPLPLPLRFEGEPGATVLFQVPEREPFGERVAPRTAVDLPVSPPATIGPLTVEAPLPNAVVSGRIPIRVSLRQARTYKFVSISVDGQPKGISNREPFYVTWDTATVADGPHLIRVRAAGGVEVETTVPVVVKNRLSGPQNPYDPAGYRTLSRRLAALLMHASPPVSVEKLLFSAYQQQDPELALDLYERMLAKDPTRVDLVEPLLSLYRAQGLAIPTAKLPEPTRGFAGGRRVALTFDDGPRPEYTPPILAVLRRYRARGTFLVTGRMSERYPELVKAIANDGHELANHTYNHIHLDKLTRAEVLYELVKTKVVLDDLVGGSSRLFRPPGGHYNQAIREIVAAAGYGPVFWSINGASFSSLAPADAAEAIGRRVEDGSILLLHNGADNTLPLLPHLMEVLNRQGLRCVTVSDLLRPPTDATAVTRPELGPLPPSALEPYAGVD